VVVDAYGALGASLMVAIRPPTLTFCGGRSEDEAGPAGNNGTNRALLHNIQTVYQLSRAKIDCTFTLDDEFLRSLTTLERPRVMAHLVFEALWTTTP